MAATEYHEALAVARAALKQAEADLAASEAEIGNRIEDARKYARVILSLEAYLGIEPRTDVSAVFTVKKPSKRGAK
jgi:hypothetical protein